MPCCARAGPRSRRAAAVAGGSLLAWQVQRPLQRALGWRGAERRFTGSYAVADGEGNTFPETSWVADRPRAIARGYRLAVAGEVERELELTAAELDRGDSLRATLDCTGGFYAEREWRAVRLVAPGRRGFQWVKWITRIEVHDGPDPGAPASTVWSSFTPEGRGDA